MSEKKTVMQVSETGHWKELFPKKNMLLGSHNLNDSEVLIGHIDYIEVGEFKNQVGETETAPTIYFKNIPPMILNVTNSRTIEKLYGWRYKDWRGKAINIFRAINKSPIGGTHKLVVSSEIPSKDKPEFNPDKHMKNAVSAYIRDGNCNAIEKHVTMTDDDRLAVESKSKEAAE